MIKLKQKIRINPILSHELDDILNKFHPFDDNIEAKYLSKGDHAYTFLINIKSRKLFDNTFVNVGKYVLKIYLKENKLSIKAIKRLELLSKYGLIPEIYVINKQYILMKFINGKTLEQKLKEGLSLQEFNNIFVKIYNLTEKWNELGFLHGDLHEDNILITSNNRVCFIDPNISTIFIEFERDKNEDLNDLEDLEKDFLFAYYD